MNILPKNCSRSFTPLVSKQQAGAGVLRLPADAAAGAAGGSAGDAGDDVIDAEFTESKDPPLHPGTAVDDSHPACLSGIVVGRCMTIQ